MNMNGDDVIITFDRDAIHRVFDCHPEQSEPPKARGNVVDSNAGGVLLYLSEDVQLGRMKIQRGSEILFPWHLIAIVGKKPFRNIRDRYNESPKSDLIQTPL